MKTLVLIRHAKSSWSHGLQDVDRPLSDRGFNDANLLSNEFKTLNFIPDSVFSSPANRALTTCAIFLWKLCKYQNATLQISNQLYDFEGRKVLDFIRHFWTIL
ncbi:MAG: phosphoglycerate mutase family protein [Gelidibacter sp.]